MTNTLDTPATFEAATVSAVEEPLRTGPAAGCSTTGPGPAAAVTGLGLAPAQEVAQTSVKTAVSKASERCIRRLLWGVGAGGPAGPRGGLCPLTGTGVPSSHASPGSPPSADPRSWPSSRLRSLDGILSVAPRDRARKRRRSAPQPRWRRG